MSIGIGIDTGGTYTDAVIYDFEKREVLASGKSLTTKENLEIGIIRALDSLPGELLHQAQILSLSTTLATNACVEDKGGRAKLILLGTSDKVLSWVNAKARYGLRSEDVFCIDTPSIYRGETGEDTDWYQALAEQKEFLSDAQALAVAEVFGMQNGAVCERFAREQLTKTYPVPFVMSNELAAGLNIMERGATALLNARLLPIIEEFLKAVRSALEKRGLNVTEMIVRSDGSLMSRQVALHYPVQTILSGPASSVIGARNLSASRDCLIVDMGGTTTDISIIKNDIPEMSERITIGGYKTQIRGVYIDTFGLGGDSRLMAVNDRLTLDTRRVQPLCVAAQAYPELIPQLEELVRSGKVHTKPLHEVLYLVREPQNPEAYSPLERSIIGQLKAHPMILGGGELDIYNLKTERLEKEGIVMRCGLTPTDIMHIRGDFSKYDRTASILGARYLMHNLPEYRSADLDQFCEDVYDMVCRKLYVNIIKILFMNAYPDVFADGLPEELMELIRRSWKEEDKRSFFGFDFHTDATLVGIGAPTHIFLPQVAKALQTRCVIPPHAEVANAVGAITADISARREIVISPDHTGEDLYRVYGSHGEQAFDTLEEAVDFARQEARALALQDARKRGAVGELTAEVTVHSQSAQDKSGAAIELDTTVVARARGKVYS